MDGGGVKIDGWMYMKEKEGWRVKWMEWHEGRRDGGRVKWMDEDLINV